MNYSKEVIEQCKETDDIEIIPVDILRSMYKDTLIEIKAKEKQIQVLDELAKDYVRELNKKDRTIKRLETQSANLDKHAQRYFETIMFKDKVLEEMAKAINQDERTGVTIMYFERKVREREERYE